MGDDAVIVEGVDSEEAKALVDGAQRWQVVWPQRSQAQVRAGRWTPGWRGVTLVGADLTKVRWPTAGCRGAAEHAGSIRVQHTLRPSAVATAGENDPFKD